MKYSVKLFLSILLLLTLTVSLGGNLLMYSSFQVARQEELDRAEQSYKLVQYTATAAGIISGVIQMDNVVNVLEQMRLEEGAVLRLQQGDITMYRTDPDCELFSDDLAVHASDSALAMQVFIAEDGTHYVQITGLLPTENITVVLDGIFQIESAYETLHTQQHIYRQIFVITMLFGVVIAVILQHWLTKPLKKLSAAAKKIAGGELSVRAEERGSDEFAALAADFNHMTDELVNEMRRQRDFTGAFAHELKTPMTSIIGYADLLRSRKLDEHTRQQAANYIFTESRRLENLSFKLLDLLVLQRQDFPLTRQEIGAFVMGIVAEVSPALEKNGIQLGYAVQPGTWEIEPDLLKTLILNLIDNARKAMPEGGRMGLRQTMTEDGFQISVIDSGRGIPEEELGKITEAFYRVDKSRSRAQGGVGLGLAICSEIAALHGGTLQFDSVLGEGTCVTLHVRRAAS